MSEELTMPRLSDTMEEGTIGRWLKHEGESFHQGDVIAEIETDKATMDFQAYDDGTLLKILVGGRRVGASGRADRHCRRRGRGRAGGRGRAARLPAGERGQRCSGSSRGGRRRRPPPGKARRACRGRRHEPAGKPDRPPDGRCRRP